MGNIRYILWVTLKLYPVGDVLWVTLKVYPVGDVLWATLKLYPVGNMSDTHRIYRMLSTGLKMLPTGHHPQDKISACGQHPVGISCGMYTISCGYILWTTHDILWIYPVDYIQYPVGTSCGLHTISCGYILWATHDILWVYPVGYNVYIVYVNTIIVYVHIV